MNINLDTPPSRTIIITLTRDEAARLDRFLLDGPLWRPQEAAGSTPSLPAHAGGPLAEALSEALTKAFDL